MMEGLKADVVDSNASFLNVPEHWEVRESAPHHLQFAHFRPRKIIYFDPEYNCLREYRSRQHRKNRGMTVTALEPDKTLVLPSLPTILKLDFTNISWHVAFWFTLGSIAWIINGHFSLWQVPNAAKNKNIVGYSALAGGLLFWLGAYCAILESLNESDDLSNVTNVSNVMEDEYGHPGHVRRYLLYRMRSMESKPTAAVGLDGGQEAQSKKRSRHKWRWWGYEPTSIGYLASTIQFCGATFFTISVISGVPGVIRKYQWQLQQAFQWTPQVVGALCFIISSVLMMLEEQETWYLPALDRIGWHAATWNLVGSIGFLLSPSFAYLANWKGEGVVCCQFWGTGFNTYYGSWAFLVGSVLMLIEAQNQQPSASFGRIIERGALWLVYSISSVMPAKRQVSALKRAWHP